MEVAKSSILIVDDEDGIHEFLTYNLEKADFVVYNAKSGIEGIKIAQEKNPDIILLDVMMPEMDGIMTCLEMRKITSLNKSFIIFLTARGEDYSQIAGYEAGGDDYLKKPIAPSVLIAKLKQLLIRNKLDNGQTIFEEKIIDRGNIVIDTEKYMVFFNQKEITLPRKEFQLLTILALKPNKVFTRDEIFHSIWGDNNGSGYRTIDVHIRKLRKKLGEDIIKTQKGVGYIFQE
jgi:two-component system alkaline phosphatase synthesis response regulator PhoP